MPQACSPQWNNGWPIAARPASSDPGSTPTTSGGVVRWLNGSETPENTRPIPMPAENSIANHENSENSGRSSSRPSRTLPTLDNAAHTQNSSIAVTTMMYHQPTLTPMESLRSVKACVASSPYLAPNQMAKANAVPITTTAGTNTGRDSLAFGCSSCSC